MEDVRHVRMSFGEYDKFRTRHMYTEDQARELQEIAVRAAKVAEKHGGDFRPQPITVLDEQ